MSKWRVLTVLMLLQIFLCSVGVWGHMTDIPDWILFWSVFPTLVLFIAFRKALKGRSNIEGKAVLENHAASSRDV
jgi:hypothetical protein